jgi:hypothetical protein
MEVALVDKFDLFFCYALNDVLLLEKVVKCQLVLINWVLSHVLKLPDKFCFHAYNLPSTQGCLVSQIFLMSLKSSLELPSKNAEPDSVDSYVSSLDPETRRGLLFSAFAKLGLLKSESKNVAKNLDFHEKIFRPCTIREFVEERLKVENVASFVKEYKKNYEFSAFSQASIDYFLGFFTGTTALYNALVSGGRTVNERPKKFLASYCADIDLRSCYGSALREFHFPLGRPEVVAFTQN